MSKQQLICTEHNSSLVPTDFILLYKKDNERLHDNSLLICRGALLYTSCLAVVDELFGVNNYAGQWSGCIHWRNMKSVHIIGCSVSTPRKMCSEPRASSASRKSPCKRSSSTRGLLSTYLFQLDMKIVRGLAAFTFYFYSNDGVVDKLLMFWCPRCWSRQFNIPMTEHW